MKWIRIKHTRKFKSYLKNLGKQVKSPTKQTFMLLTVSDPSTNSEFFVTRNYNVDFGLIVLSVVYDKNLFMMYGFSFDDQIERAKAKGQGFYKDFITVFDLYRHGDEMECLPEILQEFWNGI